MQRDFYPGQIYAFSALARNTQNSDLHVLAFVVVVVLRTRWPLGAFPFGCSFKFRFVFMCQCRVFRLKRFLPPPPLPLSLHTLWLGFINLRACAPHPFVPWETGENVLFSVKETLIILTLFFRLSFAWQGAIRTKYGFITPASAATLARLIYAFVLISTSSACCREYAILIYCGRPFNLFPVALSPLPAIIRPLIGFSDSEFYIWRQIAWLTFRFPRSGRRSNFDITPHRGAADKDQTRRNKRGTNWPAMHHMKQWYLSNIFDMIILRDECLPFSLRRLPFPLKSKVRTARTRHEL